MGCYLCNADIGDGQGLCRSCFEKRKAARMMRRQQAPASRVSIPPKQVIIGLLLVLVLVIIASMYGFSIRSSLRQPPGVWAADDPKQDPITNEKRPWRTGQYTVYPLARFDMSARVLLTARYYFASAADVVPLDLTLAWGQLSDQRIVDRINFSHGYRYYF